MIFTTGLIMDPTELLWILIQKLGYSIHTVSANGTQKETVWSYSEALLYEHPHDLICYGVY